MWSSSRLARLVIGFRKFIATGILLQVGKFVLGRQVYYAKARRFERIGSALSGRGKTDPQPSVIVLLSCASSEIACDGAYDGSVNNS